MSLESSLLKPFTKAEYEANWWELYRNPRYREFMDTVDADWEKFKKVARSLGYDIKEDPTPDANPEWGEVCP